MFLESSEGPLKKQKPSEEAIENDAMYRKKPCGEMSKMPDTQGVGGKEKRIHVGHLSAARG